MVVSQHVFTLREGGRHAITELLFHKVYTEYDPVLVVEVGREYKILVGLCGDEVPILHKP